MFLLFLVPETALTARLFRMNNSQELAGYGAEALRDILNSYFGSLMDIIEKHGGDVLRVAGCVQNNAATVRCMGTPLYFHSSTESSTLLLTMLYLT